MSQSLSNLTLWNNVHYIFTLIIYTMESCITITMQVTNTKITNTFKPDLLFYLSTSTVHANLF